MYPYFQKNQKPNPSNSSKLSVREASPADPLRQFLAENPAFGTLLFQVTGGQGAVPIERATVVISKALPNGHTLSVTTTPSSLNVGAALGGLAIVVVFVAVIAFLITNTNKHLKSEYALNASKA